MSLYAMEAAHSDRLAKALQDERDAVSLLSQEKLKAEAQLKACREELTKALMQDSRIRGRAAVAEAAIRELQEKDPTYAVPAEVTDLLEVLR